MALHYHGSSKPYVKETCKGHRNFICSCSFLWYDITSCTFHNHILNFGLSCKHHSSNVSIQGFVTSLSSMEIKMCTVDSTSSIEFQVLLRIHYKVTNWAQLNAGTPFSIRSKRATLISVIQRIIFITGNYQIYFFNKMTVIIMYVGIFQWINPFTSIFNRFCS